MEDQRAVIIDRLKALFGGANLTDTNSVISGSLMSNAYKQWTDLFFQDTYKSQSRFAKVLTSYMANLATTELAINAGPSARGEFLTAQIEAHVMPKITNIVQRAGVCGYVVLRPVVQSGGLYIDVVTPDRVVIESMDANGEIYAGAFKDYAKYKGRDVVRLEQFKYMNGEYFVHNEAHYVSGTTLSSELRMNDVPQWADIPTDYKYSGIDRPMFAVLKMPFENTIDRVSKLPVSLYADSVDSIVGLDYILDQFMREISTGKRKQVVDRTAIKLSSDGSRSLRDAQLTGLSNKDLTTDLYIKLNMGEEQKPFDDYTPAMRMTEYRQAIDTQLRVIEMQTGFSPGTFNIDTKTGLVTATQVISDARNTYNTIKAIQDSGLKKGLLDLVYIFDVFATVYNLAQAGEILPTVSFGDSIFEDTGTEFSRRKQLVDSGYLRAEKLVAWYFGVSDEEAAIDYMPEEKGLLDDGMVDPSAFR